MLVDEMERRSAELIPGWIYCSCIEYKITKTIYFFFELNDISVLVCEY